MRLRERQPLLAIHADYSRVADPGFLINVLVAVDEQARLHALDVADEGLEAEVNIFVAVVNVARAVVRHEAIYRGKRNQQQINFRLLVA